MKYFNNINNLEELKKEYKRLVIKLHPDLNKEIDTTKEFVEMQKCYDIVFNQVKFNHVNFKGETYREETQETPEEFKNIINKIVTIEGINIDIIGSWVWVTGNTYSCRDLLKQLNFKWCNNKKAWSYHSTDYKKRSRKTYTLDYLKDTFGCVSVSKQKINLLEV